MRVRLENTIGQSIDSCIVEAITASSNLLMDVVFNFNGTNVYVNIGDDKECVLNRYNTSIKLREMVSDINK